MRRSLCRLCAAYASAASRLSNVEILGFPTDSQPTMDDIRRQYKKRAAVVHPDVVGGSEEEFKKLQAAYAALLSRGTATHTQQMYAEAARRAEEQYYEDNPQARQQFQSRVNPKAFMEWLRWPFCAVVMYLTYAAWQAMNAKLAFIEQRRDEGYKDVDWSKVPRPKKGDPEPANRWMVMSDKQKKIWADIEEKRQFSGGTNCIRYKGRPFTPDGVNSATSEGRATTVVQAVTVQRGMRAVVDVEDDNVSHEIDD